MTMIKKADLIIDLQYGSTGKGLIAGYLAIKNNYDTVVTANMPNAGHTFIDDRGNKMIHKVLPNGIVSPNCRDVLIGPGAVFDLQRLIDELLQAHEFGYNKFKVNIHQNAVVLQEEHKVAEQMTFANIGSTMQGSAAAMIQKIRRSIISEENPTAKHVLKDLIELEELGIFVVDRHEYDQILKESVNILLEGAQGFSLGINEIFYPYCTSRDCTPARFMADMGIPLGMLRKVIGTARTYPIRVANPKRGTSGGWYPDQEEIDWIDLDVEPELTTVTKKVRRVFTFSHQQIKDALFHCCPDEIFLNFCNYETDLSVLHKKISSFGSKKIYFGWGPTVNDITESDDKNTSCVPEGVILK